MSSSAKSSSPSPAVSSSSLLLLPCMLAIAAESFCCCLGLLSSAARAWKVGEAFLPFSFCIKKDQLKRKRDVAIGKPSKNIEEKTDSLPSPQAESGREANAATNPSTWCGRQESMNVTDDDPSLSTNRPALQ